MSNFICTNKHCGKELIVPKYTLKIIGGKVTYFNGGVEITCPNCKQEVKFLKEFKGVPRLAKFSNQSPQEKIKTMKQRSSNHSKKNQTRD